MDISFIESVIRIQVDKRLYLKNPESSQLGLSIVREGIGMLDEMGFEEFTFRKLGARIGSNEASVYRYFESKNKFLLYLSSWYWGWMNYRLYLITNNLSSAEKRLEKALMLITGEDEGHSVNPGFDLITLGRVVCYESDKSILNREVDKSNDEGAFQNYQSFVGAVAGIVQELAPRYRFSRMLVSTVIEGVHFQKFFADHLPALTDVGKNKDYIKKFFYEMVIKTIKPKS